MGIQSIRSPLLIDYNIPEALERKMFMYISHLAGKTGMYYCTDLLFEMRSHKLFAPAGLKSQPFNLSLPSSKDYRPEPPVPSYVLFFFFN
jgi:hypothetical protein